jgi:secreted trypsin-like serine protease
MLPPFNRQSAIGNQQLAITSIGDPRCGGCAFEAVNSFMPGRRNAEVK